MNRTLPGAACRGASKTEYVVILATVSIAVLGAVTLFGRYLSRMYAAGVRSLKNGVPSAARTAFPTGNVPVGFSPPTGNLPAPYAGNDYTQYYQSLLGAEPVRASSFISGGAFVAPAIGNLPPSLMLPTNLNEQMDEAFSHSRPQVPLPPGGFPLDTDADGDGVPDFSSQLREHGATFAIDGSGNLVLVNGGPGSTNGFSGNDATPGGTTGAGRFHTHPWEHDEGTPHSDVDLMNIFSRGDAYNMVQTTNGEQWLLVRTSTSFNAPGTNRAAIQTTYNTAYAARMAALNANPATAGLPFHERHQLATEAAVLSVAQTYNLGLYRGRSGSPLTRVNPP